MAATSVSLIRVSPGRSAVPLTERVIAGVAVAAIAPAFACAMGAVRLFSGRAPLVAHCRVGQGGQLFWALKLRSMWNDEVTRGGSGWIEYLQDPAVPSMKSGPDARVTSRFAAFCRTHSIDELPQLLHVISGKMRLVGPRPMTQAELEEHYGLAQVEVLSVPPGLTGLWQVMGRNRLSYAQRKRLDLFFVRRRTWRLTARILLRTVSEVLAPRDAW
ncbi:MAG: sugar transferase [Acidobacteriota bacterium]